MEFNWSTISKHSVLGRVLRWPLKLIPGTSVFRIRRGPGKGMKWIVGSYNHGCWLGTWEFRKQQVLERFLRPGMTVYDIGAHAGFYTLIFSRLVGPGQVVAFEPFGPNVRYLLEHVRLNGLSNVRIVQAALADKAGLEGFSSDRHASENSLTGGTTAPLLVPTLTLDEAVGTHGFPPPDLLKMDVEGAESRILEGARRTIDRHRPAIFIALHGAAQGLACRKLLRELGYAAYELSGERLSESSPSEEIYALPSDGAAAPPAERPAVPARTPIPAGALPRLNLGCGSIAPAGWVNVDGSWAAWLARHPWLGSLLKGLGIYEEDPGTSPWPVGIRIHDVRKPLPFRDGSFAAVYASHLVEHLHLEETLRLLSECRRVLAPGGVLRVVVPDLKAMVREYAEAPAGAEAADRFMRRLDMRAPAPPSGGLLRTLYHALKEFRSHKWHYDAESLSARLAAAGFSDVSERRFRDSRIRGIEEIEEASRVLDGEGIIVEGAKPGNEGVEPRR